MLPSMFFLGKITTLGAASLPEERCFCLNPMIPCAHSPQVCPSLEGPVVGWMLFPKHGFPRKGSSQMDLFQRMFVTWIRKSKRLTVQPLSARKGHMVVAERTYSRLRQSSRVSCEDVAARIGSQARRTDPLPSNRFVLFQTGNRGGFLLSSLKTDPQTGPHMINKSWSLPRISFLEYPSSVRTRLFVCFQWGLRRNGLPDRLCASQCLACLQWRDASLF